MKTVIETPDLRYFRSYPSCRMCGKNSDGLLFDCRNSSYGDHCKKCADERLADSKKVREEMQDRLQAPKGAAPTNTGDQS